MIKMSKVGNCLAGILAGFQLMSCSDHKKTEDKTGLTGRFINQTFLQQIPDSVAGSIQGYCYELYFTGPDSVAVNYGFEEGILAYRKSGDRYLLEGAIQGRDMPFTVNADSSITLLDSSWVKHDTTWVGKPLNSNFKKVTDSKGQKWGLDQYLNERMLAGTYRLVEKGKRTEHRVIFTKEGKVSGLENYTAYAICFSGDCVEETKDITNSISFTTDKNTGTGFAFKIDTKNKGISFYTIGPPLKDEDGNELKGGRAILGKAFELRQ